MKGRWSGNRTRDTQIISLLLYPTELSSGDESDSNRHVRYLIVALPMSFRLAKYTAAPMAYAMAKPGAPDGAESRAAMKNRICTSFLALRKTPKLFQLALMYFRADYTRVEASRHSANALLSGLPLPSVRVRDASGRHQNY